MSRRKPQQTATAGAELEHGAGCPANPERLEQYDTTRPSGDPVHVTRCLECGAQSVTGTGELEPAAPPAPTIPDDEQEPTA